MKKYTRNPITEALIDIQVEPVLSSNPSEIEKIHEVFKDEFPEKRTRHTIESTLQIKQSIPTNAEHNVLIDGFQFWKEDKTEVIQCRLDGFSYSRLRPYDHWEIHSPKMYIAWNKYLERFKPINVKRIAVRFINVFEIPETVFKLQDYFNSTPEPPSDLPQSIGNFLQRLEISNNNEMIAVVTFTNRRPTKPNITPILFDIDVYQNVSYSANEKAIIEKIEELHIFAEKVFEGYISDKTRGLIK